VPVPQAPGPFDVEPVPAWRRTPRREQARVQFVLTWRDLLMFGSGVVGTVIMILLARALVGLL
jgi:hypothetical protein